MKKITEITNEREFVSKLRTYYRKGRRKGYQRNEISFLGVMEYTGRATREFEYQSDKYFSVGIRAYDWVHGNSLLSALIDKWENEIEAEKRKKQHTQAAETPQISTEAGETVNVSAEGERAENEPQKHISEVLKEAEQNYQCVKSETLHTVRETDGKWHTYFYFMGDEIGVDLAYDQINHIPAARTAQAAEEVAEIRRYINRLNGNHIADADYYLAEMREGIKQAEVARRKKNADTEGENAAEPRETTLSSREQVLAHLDKLHGLEYDAGEVVYFMDGCTAEEQECGTVWRVYPDVESDEVIEKVIIVPQPPEAPHKVA